MDGGWPVLNAWLAEAKKKQDFAVLVEVLQVCVCVCVCVRVCVCMRVRTHISEKTTLMAHVVLL